MQTLHRALLLSLFAIPWVAVGSASTLVYSFTGDASGSLNGSSFSDVLLTITAAGDTSAVTSPFTGVLTISFGSGIVNFSLAGVGSGTFNDATYVFDNQNFVGGVVGFGMASGDLLGIEGDQFSSTAFTTYDLKSPLGPLGYVADLAVPNWNSGSETSSGLLVVTSLTDTAFQASPLETSTPEPSTASLAGLSFGLFALAAAYKHFARR